MDLFKGVILLKHCVNIRPNLFLLGGQFMDKECQYDQPISTEKRERKQHPPPPAP